MTIYQLFNPWTVLILGIWVLGAITSMVQPKSKGIDCAVFATVAIGVGWLLLKT